MQETLFLLQFDLKNNALLKKRPMITDAIACIIVGKSLIDAIFLIT